MHRPDDKDWNRETTAYVVFLENRVEALRHAVRENSVGLGKRKPTKATKQGIERFIKKIKGKKNEHTKVTDVDQDEHTKAIDVDQA